MSVVEQPGGTRQPPVVPPTTPRTGRRFAVLESRAFRYLWANTFGFALVQSTQRFTYVWLVLELGGAEAAAGIVSFFLGIPILVLSLPVGVWSDRLDRRVLLIGSQVGALAISALTALLIWGGWITLPIAYLLAIGAGATLAVGYPVRQAIIPSVVPAERLMNAIALMALALNVSLVVGPALGGGVIAVAGLEGAFAAQAGVYAIALLALVPLRVPKIEQAVANRMWVDVREGLRFIWGHRGILALVGLLAGSGIFMLGPFFALIPPVARDRLGQDALGTSVLLSVLGAGMLITSLVLSGWGHMKNKGRVFTVNMIAGGALLSAVGLSSSYRLTLGLMFVWGLGGGLFMNLNQTLIQSNTPPQLMGRVMSVHTLAFQGLMPVGSLLAGGLGEVMGAAQWMTVSGGIVALLALAAVFTTPTLRRMS